MPNQALQYWQRFEKRLRVLGHSDYLTTWPQNVMKVLPNIIASSDFVADQLAAHPDYLTELLAADQFWHPQTAMYFSRQVLSQNWQALSLETFDQTLRSFRNKAYIRIIARDCLGLADLQETVEDLSNLADALIKQVVHYHTANLIEKHGVPQNAAGIRQDLIVLAMGKLGGRELNLSSDVDLIFVYPKEGETASGMSNELFFSKLGRLVIQSLDQKTADGFVFRVDMRLRPFGQSGPLVCHFAQLEHYYMDQGRVWERYAFIKARPVTGQYDDMVRLMAFVKSFVYRRYVDYSVIQSIREMKALIHREVLRQGDVNNLKTGTGGIREIEFVVQIFQLIRGGQISRLQTTSLLQALAVLRAEKMLPEQVLSGLQSAYLFLRRAEHALQAFEDRQTHSLPVEVESQARMACVLGFSNWKQLSQAIEGHRTLVRQCFSEMVKSPEGDTDTQDVMLELYQSWWLGELQQQQVIQLLEDTEFADAKKANCVVVDFRKSIVAQPLHTLSFERLDQLMPKLLLGLARHAHSDQVLPRIVLILEKIIRRSAYVSLLIERPKALQQLIELCETSQWIAQEIACFPHLLDELLCDYRQLKKPSLANLEQELQQLFLRVPVGDLESQMEILRRFKNIHRFHAAVGEILNVLHVTEVSDYLTHVAECVLKSAVNISVQHLIAKHGLPAPLMELKDVNQLPFLIIAYGKMGSSEMSYGSDMDLVFAYQAQADGVTQGHQSIENQVWFTRLAQRVIHILTTKTYGGHLYEVDTRLRPSGESGLLVCQLQYIENYMYNNAWTWEHQALVRARGVCGQPALLKVFAQLRQKILCLPRPDYILQVQVAKMREKMREQMGASVDQMVFDIKHGEGGIIDIEFIVQYGVLLWAQTHADLVSEVGTLKILDQFVQLGLFEREQTQALQDAFIEYRSMVHLLTIKELPAQVAADRFDLYRQSVRSVWKQLVGSHVVGSNCQ